jgi:ketosteroid isomerase-like protein
MSAGKSTQITTDYLTEIVDAFNRHDVDQIVSYFADDGEFYMAHGPEAFGRRLKGKEEIRDVLAKRFEKIQDMRWIGEAHWVFGNKALSEWTVQGTMKTGERIDWLGCDLWEFQNGKIVKKDTYWKQVVK